MKDRLGTLRLQHQPKGNNSNSNRNLMQHLCCSRVVALLSPTVDKVTSAQHMSNSIFNRTRQKHSGTTFHWEIKGRFRKRVVLASVPSFRFSFRGNIRRNHPFGNHPFVNTKKGHWEIKGRFPKGWFWRTYPRSGFRSGGTSAKTTLLETTLLRTPELCLKHNKTRCTREKRDRIKNLRHGQHPEQDQNEIGTRYEVAYFEARKGQDSVACQYTLGFSLLEGQMSRNTYKTRYTLEKRDWQEIR